MKVKATGTISAMEIEVTAGSTYLPRPYAIFIKHQATRLLGNVADVQATSVKLLGYEAIQLLGLDATR